MCTGRLDLNFLLRSFAKGADGVFIAGCHLNECNYITHGNFYALSMTHLCKKLIEQVGVNPERLRMELISGGEGNRFAEIMNDFAGKVKELGPLGTGEGEDAREVKTRLDRVLTLVPYIKKEERKKLGIRFQSKDEYKALYTGEEIDRLLNDAVSYYIEPSECRSCMTCARRCPVDAIDGGKNIIHVIDQEKCIKCGTCLEACPPRFGAVTRIQGGPVPPPLPAGERTVVRKKKESAA